MTSEKESASWRGAKQQSQMMPAGFNLVDDVAKVQEEGSYVSALKLSQSTRFLTRCLNGSIVGRWTVHVK